MLIIEYIAAGTGCILTLLFGFFLGRTLAKRSIKKQWRDDIFLSKYYLWFSNLANKHKYTTDQLKAYLLKYGDKKQTDLLEAYYLKQRAKHQKRRKKEMKQDALRKKYQDIINDKPLK